MDLLYKPASLLFSLLENYELKCSTIEINKALLHNYLKCTSKSGFIKVY